MVNTTCSTQLKSEQNRKCKKKMKKFPFDKYCSNCFHCVLLFRGKHWQMNKIINYYNQDGIECLGMV